MKNPFAPYVNEAYTVTQPNVAEAFKNHLQAGEARLGQDWPLIIGGERITTGAWIESHDPCRTDRLVGRAAAAEAHHVDQAVAAAMDAQPLWGARPMVERARALAKLAGIMRRRKWELAAWEVYEAGKNYLEAEADVAEAIDFCDYYARQAMELDDILPTHDVPGEENTMSLQPIGVGVVIPPWNFLLAIMVGTTVAPVVTGNTVVLKPSPKTPIIAGVFMDIVHEAGFPPGVINLLTGEDAVLGDALVEHEHTRFINFTGSVATGLRIHEKAAQIRPNQRFLKKTFLELGGKDALIVDETADLDAAADAAVASAFGFQGQKCSAMSRLIVVDAVHDALLEKVKARMDHLSVGDATDNADVCAVIDETQYRKILGFIDRAQQDATLELGGKAAKEGGWFIEPTLFSNVDPSSEIAQEEIFGPVVAVLRARDFDHAIELANGTRYALTGGLFSRLRDRIERARKEVRVGNLYINRKITGSLVGTQPFGGFDMSGTNSKAGGPDYLRLFMEAKTVTERF